MTIRAGVVGWPVEHSLSPVLHGHWLDEHGIDGRYEKIAAQPDAFEAAIHRLRAEGYAGVNVTVPHKEAAFALADEIDSPQAKFSGAANLLVFKNKKIHALNTDASGFSDSVETSLPSGIYSGKSAVLLGAGGAARAIVIALNYPLTVSTIHVLNRSADRAHSLVEHLSKFIATPMHASPLTEWPQVAKDARLLINSTSAGMTGNSALDLDLSVLHKDAAVCDIVYNPLQTPLLKDAAARGHKTVDGLGMLMHQAVPSFEAFFGVRPTVTPGLRAALEKVLRERQQ